MCGIAGWVDYRGSVRTQAATAEAMGETLSCRGPDASGSFFSDCAALVHRRLARSIPRRNAAMVRSPAGNTFAVTYNGELYNAPSCVRNLKPGLAFQTHSDTSAAPRTSNGARLPRAPQRIFAAIWNEAERTCSGKRPPGRKAALLCRLGRRFSSAPNPRSWPPAHAARRGRRACGDLRPGTARTRHGVYKQLREVKAGWCLTVSPNGVSHRRYWQLESRPHEDDFPATVARVRELLADAVQRQLVADVPVCTLLSGGLDSSAITAFAAQAFAREGKGPLNTYSVDYAGNARHFQPNSFQPEADARYIQLVAQQFGTVHRDVVIEGGQLAAALPAAVRARDLPGMADIDASLYLFCREIRKDATVALSGECADEIRRLSLVPPGGAVIAETFPWSRTAPAHRLPPVAPRPPPPRGLCRAALPGEPGRGAPPAGRAAPRTPLARDRLPEHHVVHGDPVEPQGPHEHGHGPRGAGSLR